MSSTHPTDRTRGPKALPIHFRAQAPLPANSSIVVPEGHSKATLYIQVSLAPMGHHSDQYAFGVTAEVRAFAPEGTDRVAIDTTPSGPEILAVFPGLQPLLEMCQLMGGAPVRSTALACMQVLWNERDASPKRQHAVEELTRYLFLTPAQLEVVAASFVEQYPGADEESMRCQAFYGYLDSCAPRWDDRFAAACVLLKEMIVNPKLATVPPASTPKMKR